MKKRTKIIRINHDTLVVHTFKNMKPLNGYAAASTFRYFQNEKRKMYLCDAMIQTTQCDYNTPTNKPNPINDISHLVTSEDRESSQT